MAKSRIQDYLVMDTETGGLPSKTKFGTLDIALCEVAMVMVSPELKIVGKGSFLIKPYEAEYQSKALSVNGLTMEVLRNDGIHLNEGVPTINDFINSYKTTKTKPVLVGHNMKRFDLQFIENLYLMHKKDLWKSVNNYVIDTLELSHMMYPEAPNFKLGTMVGQFDIELVDSHRAVADAISTAELLINYLKNLRGENNVQSEVQIEEVKQEVKNFKF